MLLAFKDGIARYENDGAQNFTVHFITTDRALQVYATDVDSDGDVDVISALSSQDEIAWYENDGNENFTTHIISTEANYPQSVYAADIDGDSDIDVLSTSESDNKIAWYENDGNENFTTHIISTDAVKAKTVFSGDVDGDGDIDVLSASALDGEINWYENLSIVNVEQVSNKIPNEFSLQQNYPNPFNPSTKIENTIPIVETHRDASLQVRLTVFDVLGNEVAELVNEEQPAGTYRADFTADELASGLYFAQLGARNFSKTIKMSLMK